MKKKILFVCTVFCLLLFASASAANYIGSQKAMSASLFEQASDDCEENESPSNEKESNELEDEDNVKLLDLITLASTISVSDYKKAFDYKLVDRYFLEVTSPPPQV